MLFASCSKDGDDIPVTSVTLDRTSLDLIIGKTDTLRATVLPKNATKNGVAWLSEDKSIVSVDQNGVITALALGKTKVIAISVDRDRSAVCEVTVVDKQRVKIIADAEKTLIIGKEVPVGAITEPEGVALVYSSDDESVVKVSKDGILTAIAPGEAYITIATAPSPDYKPVTIMSKITVIDKYTPVISVAARRVILVKDENDNNIDAEVAPDFLSIHYSSDNDDISINSKGYIFASQEGEATITITTDETEEYKAGEATCIVTAVSANDIIPAKFSIGGGKQVYFSKGNLQATYSGSENSYTWGFAKKQSDHIGTRHGNTNIGSHNSGDVVDLFGWSTELSNYGISASTSSDDYSGVFKDWGGLFFGTWRTLSSEEWDALMKRPKSYSWVTLADEERPGILLYPDDYTGEVVEGTIDRIPDKCVFLPVTGYREGNTVKSPADWGYYWTSDYLYDNTTQAKILKFSSTTLDTPKYDRYFGGSVRLILDVAIY